MNLKKNNVLILGATGMLGSTLIKYLSKDETLNVYGTARDKKKSSFLSPSIQGKLFYISLNCQNLEDLGKIIAQIKPGYVINCLGIIKQSPLAERRKVAIELNSLLPHLIAECASRHKARLIHFSTDCIFSGSRGGYLESDKSDAFDIYGKSKFLGEVDYGNHLTIRTSIIGHEIGSALSLLDWFLSQTNEVNGYARAIYSGVTTLELAKIIKNYIFTNDNLHGLYHISSRAISKFELLSLINKIYKKNIQINPDNNFVIDRSLDSSYFQKKSGYKPIDWNVQISELYQFNQDNSFNRVQHV